MAWRPSPVAPPPSDPEKGTHAPFSAFLRDRIFIPLGMANTHLNDAATLVVPGRVTGYLSRSDALSAEARTLGVHIRGGAGWVRMLRNSPHYGGSGVFSSLEDLARWSQNFYTERVGGPGFAELMHRRMTFAHPKDNDAFGLLRSEMFGREVWAYSGGDHDTSTYMARLPAERLTVICLSNLSAGNAEGMGRAVLALLNGAGVI